MLVSCISNLGEDQRINSWPTNWCDKYKTAGGLTNLLRTWHSKHAVVGSRRCCRGADPGCRPLPGWIWASLQCWAQAADSAPLPGPCHPRRDPTGCCWTVQHPGTCSASTEETSSKGDTTWTSACWRTEAIQDIREICALEGFSCHEDSPCEQTGQRSAFHTACWQKSHKHLLSWSTETPARHWAMAHLVADPKHQSKSDSHTSWSSVQSWVVYHEPGPGNHGPPPLWRWHSQQEWTQRTRRSCQAQQWCKPHWKEGSKGPPWTWLCYWPAEDIKHNWSCPNPTKGVAILLKSELYCCCVKCV